MTRNVEFAKEIAGERFVCKRYCKHAQYQNADGRITGYALDGSKMTYAVIDFDWNKSLDISDDEKNELLCKMIGVFENKAKIVKTGSGGVHLYVNYDNAWKNNNIKEVNRYTKVYMGERFDIDVFVAHNSKQSLVMLPNSQVKNTDKSGKVIEDSPVKYYVLKHNTDDDKLISFTEALAILDKDFDVKIDVYGSEYSVTTSKNNIKDSDFLGNNVTFTITDTIDFTEIIDEIKEYDYKIVEEVHVINDLKCLELLLKCFEPTHNSLEKLCCIIGASPFDQEILLKYFEAWYFYEGHTHNNMGTVNVYVRKYFRTELSNKWFYSTVNKLPAQVKEAFLNKFAFKTLIFINIKTLIRIIVNWINTHI